MLIEIFRDFGDLCTNVSNFMSDRPAPFLTVYLFIGKSLQIFVDCLIPKINLGFRKKQEKVSVQNNRCIASSHMFQIHINREPIVKIRMQASWFNSKPRGFPGGLGSSVA